MHVLDQPGRRKSVTARPLPAVSEHGGPVGKTEFHCLLLEFLAFLLSMVARSKFWKQLGAVPKSGEVSVYRVIDQALKQIQMGLLSVGGPNYTMHIDSATDLRPASRNADVTTSSARLARPKVERCQCHVRLGASFPGLRLLDASEELTALTLHHLYSRPDVTATRPDLL